MKPKSSLKVAQAAFPDTISSSSASAVLDNLPAPVSEQPGIKRILVPMDFSPASVHALDYALMLAGAFEAKLVLLHVLEPPGYGSGYLAEAEERLKLQMQTQGQELMNAHRKRTGRHVPSETLVRIGRPWSEIPDTARAVGADLIVLGAHGHGSAAPSALGGTAEKVLRHAYCPVLTVS